ncbi:hypothetical protein FIBSPDRAFT_922742 [Athelia psychrophila]|uniref:AB hydrolase-1 domain-containing protein n=1 Tax=Athelia psychrophila TaxID=1759441 RepID=A0A165WX44_9AGAM|nr:hypothetical protein FIBSPDRAFT_922742 [Fibularhizoctonia sp. CBS 109695]
MIGKTLHEYIGIRLAITAIRLVAPLSLLYIALSLAQRRVLVSPWLAAYAALEASFYLLVYLPRDHYLQKVSLSLFAPAAHPPPIDFAARQALFKRCKSYLVGHAYPTGWFTRPDFKREDVVHWTLWALFYSDTALPEWEEEIDGYVADIEKILGRELERGESDASLPEKSGSMRLTFDPVHTLHRPFAWYMTVGVVDAISSLSLLRAGFTHYATPKWFTAFPFRPLTVFSKRSAHSELSYAYRPHRSSTKLPIVFLHGIGIGTWPYLPFFADLIKQDPDVGILVIEILPISMHITRPVLPSAEFVEAFTSILDSLAPGSSFKSSDTSSSSNSDETSPLVPAQPFARFVLASHSYGTVMSAWILHNDALKARVAATAFIDPIPFLLHLPALAYNFVYRRPSTANEWQLWYFASRDADVGRTLGRHFFWAENVLWKDELEDMEEGVGGGGRGRGMRTGVVLSGDDQVVDAEEVRKYLTGSEVPAARWVAPARTPLGQDGAPGEGEGGKMEVLFYPGLDHATVFDTHARREAVVEMLGRFVRLE